MKIKTPLIMGTMVLTVILLGSCSLFLGTSIDERVTNFQKDLNTSDRTNIIDNFSKNSCQAYNLINDSNYWNTTSFFTPEKRNYSISVSKDSSTTASGTINFTTGTKNIFFEFVNDGTFPGGEDWKITKIWLDTKDASGEEIKILSN